MDKNRCDLLIKKAQKLVSKYLGRKYDIDILEKYLRICISLEFKYLYNEQDYEYSPGYFDFSNFPLGVIEGTKELRDEGLPHRFLLLSDYGGDAGSIFMETQDDPEKPSPIYWCDAEDVYNLCEEGVFKYNPTVWASFTDFFEYLVNEEEKRQLEEGRLKAPIKIEEENLIQTELF